MKIEEQRRTLDLNSAKSECEKLSKEFARYARPKENSGKSIEEIAEFLNIDVEAVNEILAANN